MVWLSLTAIGRLYDRRVKARGVLLPVLALAAIAAALAWFFLGGRAGRGTVARTEHAEAELVAAREAAEAGSTVLVALRLKAQPGWHTYWRNPGDSGQPTSIEWTLPPGFSAGAIRWPVPQRLPIGPLANYGYEGEVLLASELRVPADATRTARIAARARWLVCDPEHCIPEQAEVTLALPIGRGGPGKWSGAFEAIRLPKPPPADWTLAARREGDRVLLEVTGCDEPQVYFFPYEEGKVEHGAPQGLECTARGIRVAIPVSKQPVGEFARLAGVLAARDGRAYEIDVPVANAK
jgi:thiol:disulfide interchange protein DsbD